MESFITDFNPEMKEIHIEIIKVLEKNNLYIKEAVQTLHETEIILERIHNKDHR